MGSVAQGSFGFSRPLIFAALLIFSISFAQCAYAAQQQPMNSSVANQINYTYSYIQHVNESAYLIFYPNLSRAYALTAQANASTGKGNFTGAIALLQMAQDSAAQQYKIIEGSSTAATYIMLAITFATVSLLYFIMLPRKRRTRRS